MIIRVGIKKLDNYISSQSVLAENEPLTSIVLTKNQSTF